MTQEEVVFCKVVEKHAPPGYSVVKLRPDDGMNTCSFKLKQLGAPESEARHFTVCVDELRSCIMTGQLPECLLRDIADELK